MTKSPSHPLNRIAILIILGIAGLLLFELPYVYQGMDSHIRLHDNLDAFPVAYAAATYPAFETPDGSFSFLLGGLPREAVSLEPDAILFLYRWLPDAAAFLFNDFVCRLIGFVGMFLLLWGFDRSSRGLATAVAFAYATLPLPYTSFEGLSALGIPILILATIFGLRREKPHPAVALALALYCFAFPFYASLAWTGIFLVPALFLTWMIAVVRYHKLHPILLLFAILLFVGYLVANHTFILNVLSENKIAWHREEVSLALPLSKIIHTGLLLPIESQYHAFANPAWIWVATLVFFTVVVSRWRSRKKTDAGESNLSASPFPRIPGWMVSGGGMAFLLVAAVASGYHFLMLNSIPGILSNLLILCFSVGWVTITCFRATRSRSIRGFSSDDAAAFRIASILVFICLFIGGFYIFYRTMISVEDIQQVLKKIPFVGTTQYDRLYFFYPMIFFPLFFFVLRWLMKQGSLLKIAVVLLLVFQIAGNVGKADWIAERSEPTVGEFFSVGAFDGAESIIHRSREDVRIACLGFHSSVAHYNGYATIGGYWPIYPLEYKHKFRPVIARELEKSDVLKKYFDDWGHRCYVVSAELGPDFMVTLDSEKRQVDNLEIDVETMKLLGAQFLFSAVRIGNADSLGIQLMGKSESDDSAFRLFVYRL